MDGCVNSVAPNAPDRFEVLESNLRRLEDSSRETMKQLTERGRELFGFPEEDDCKTENIPVVHPCTMDSLLAGVARVQSNMDELNGMVARIR